MDLDDYSTIKHFRYGSMPGTETFTQLQPYLWGFFSPPLHTTKEVLNGFGRLFNN